MNIKILVATHKQYWMPADDVYVPIHVGKEEKQDLGYMGDNTGDHISLKNPNYCELTGLYWAWKNLDADYIGLVHYRRYFVRNNIPFYKKGIYQDILMYNDFERILDNTDIIVPNKRQYYIESIYNQYIHAHDAKPMELLGAIIHEQCPQYDDAYYNLSKRKWAHMFNMFVMKRDKFNAYCEWLFSILFELERRLDYIEPRLFGFLSERMLDIWLETSQYTYREVPVAFMESQNWSHKIYRFIKRKIGYSHE